MSDSYIRGTTFSNNENFSLDISFDDGIFEIQDSTFENNSCVDTCIFLTTDEDTDEDPCYTKISKTTFKGNNGVIISFPDENKITRLDLQENTFM